MSNLLLNLWKDDEGFIVSLELLLIASILVLGLVAGMRLLQTGMLKCFNGITDNVNSINAEYTNVISQNNSIINHVNVNVNIENTGYQYPVP